ncbi:MAG: glycosyltransferase family 4 protein [Anaerolineales bacterium]|nr:glycosyltransferase family 4 protein [Anaerolineales bacterium]
MKRILYFSRSYTVHDHRFLTALVSADYQVYYLCLEKHPYALDERVLPEGVKQVDWAGGKRPFSWLDFPRLLVDLKRVLAEVKPDLVQAGPIQTAALLAALTGYQPLISMSWGYDLLIDAERNAIWRWATRYVFRHSAAMLGDCNTIRKKAIAYGMADERIVTFPWGVDLDQFSPGGKRYDRETITMLSTRSWEPIYGVDILAQAFVFAARQQASLQLVMLGNGSMKNQLMEIFREAGMLERVSFPGQIGQADLPSYYLHADIYACASHSDGTSISLLEALASGCPVIVSDIPGNREWVTPGVHGWLFPDGNARAMGQVIINAVENRQQFKEISYATRLLAEQRADWNKNFHQLFNVYKLAFQYADKKLEHRQVIQ